MSKLNLDEFFKPDSPMGSVKEKQREGDIIVNKDKEDYISESSII